MTEQNVKSIAEKLNSEEAAETIAQLVPHIAAAVGKVLMSDPRFLEALVFNLSRIQDSSKNIAAALESGSHWAEFAPEFNVCNLFWIVRFTNAAEFYSNAKPSEQPLEAIPFLEVVPDITLETIGEHYVMFNREGIPQRRGKEGQFAHVFAAVDKLLMASLDTLFYNDTKTVNLRLPGDGVDERQEAATTLHTSRLKAIKEQDRLLAEKEQAGATLQ